MATMMQLGITLYTMYADHSFIPLGDLKVIQTYSTMVIGDGSMREAVKMNLATCIISQLRKLYNCRVQHSVAVLYHFIHN